ncbi:hypothetical protein QAD02_000156 [Eretmocerus hayati]|uniref:Uncharacterized protein n=1 Tax=Eretmocerus hayati TaxID=131215 RepID=A0ACC2NCN1_9HYME|nr:hypothetical protein QAD02_000156 [Eretmocerus hayati]
MPHFEDVSPIRPLECGQNDDLCEIRQVFHDVLRFEDNNGYQRALDEQIAMIPADDAEDNEDNNTHNIRQCFHDLIMEDNQDQQSAVMNVIAMILAADAEDVDDDMYNIRQCFHDLLMEDDENQQSAVINHIAMILAEDDPNNHDQIRNLFAEVLADDVQDRIRLLRKMADKVTKIERQLLRLISKPFLMNDLQFRHLYRLTPQAAIDLVALLGPQLMENTRTRLPPDSQVLIGLRFLGYGGFQRSISQNYRHPVCQSLVSYVIDRFVTALCNFMDEFIVFPRNQQERMETQARFRQSIRIPGILGLVDGFLVRFLRPRVHEEAYYNYKEKHSMNVQLVCDARGIIIGLRISPGSNNDMFNWENSYVRQVLLALRADREIVAREGIFYVLGDNGFNPSEVMLTPVENAQDGTPEGLYTEEHCETRSFVERTIGALSGIWKCINRGRKLWYTSEKVAKFITAAAVLHNFRKFYNLPDNEFPAGKVIQPNERANQVLDEDYYAGVMEREAIIRLLYS